MKGFGSRPEPGGDEGGRGVAESRYSSVGEIFHVDIHSGTGKKVRRKLEDVHRLPKHELSMPEGLLSTSGY
ncbi:hypothetical protein Tco_1384718 [Tanacetum coccineum]